MLNFHNSHKNLVGTSLFVFVGLSFVIAVFPAYRMQETQPLQTMNDLSPAQRKGLGVYVAENCMACHTQQVRNIEMDNVWGDRPSLPSDYYYSKQRMDFWRQSPSLLGSERTGPDLTNVGNRQPGMEWHLLHLFNPRIVVKESVMPSYPWMFQEIEEMDLREDDVVVPVPAEYLKKTSNKIIAKAEVLMLVDYLLSLKQAPLIAENDPPLFIPSQRQLAPTSNTTIGEGLPDGESLYMNTCSACHQADGKGLPGAFPPLAGSSIVNDENPETLIQIVLQGYDARSEFGTMPAFAQQLTDEEVAAITNHERSSWGNNASPITAEEVKKIREYIEALPL